jgi:hypothetical protein
MKRDGRALGHITRETRRQTFMRHNGIMSMSGYKRCRTCNPMGAIKVTEPCRSKKPCSNGWRVFTIARLR